MVSDKAILLVEDNPDEEALTIRAMRRCHAQAELKVARDGVEALEYFFRSPGTPRVRLPRVVILDLKLPRLDGFDVIRELRADAQTRLLPVVVFSSSAETRDVTRCYEMGVNGYVTKPVTAESYQDAISRMIGYWLGCNVDPWSRK